LREKPAISKYTPSDKVGQQPVTQKTLKMYVNSKLETTAFQNIIAEYKKVHPEVSFEIRDLSANDGEGKLTFDMLEQRTQLLQTEMMAGLGPDLIEFNEVLPYQNYADKGMLEVLTRLLPEESTPEGAEYYYNIINACKYRGEIYAVPLGVSLYLIGADKEVLESEAIDMEEAGFDWKSFFDAARKVTKDTDGDGVTDRFAFSEGSISYFSTFIPERSMSQFVDYESRTAFFDSEEFIEILNFVKELSKENLSHPEITYMEMRKSNPKIIVSECFYVSSDHDFSEFKRVFEGREVEYCSIPSWEKDEEPWCTLLLSLGLNKKCSYKDDASDFIKFALSSDMQTILCKNYNSIPVNKKARENLKKIWLEESPILNNKYPISPQDTNIIDRFINECNEIVYTDPVIKNIIEEEITSFISGNKTAEQTAKSIQDKVNTYLKQ
jgi:multiple sugar transport system substrate-binding protein